MELLTGSLQLSQLLELLLQAMPKRAFQSQFVEQFFGFRQGLVCMIAPFEQGLPTPRNFSFGQHVGYLG
jgi:hypothetical protein